ncbi:hypothetical protein EST38_g11100 [Candolleomyces aberdarensis]|uniref:Uncharacterized protein n=1 Tax=Candolleomyces aberdarensis TaxID=2316362 RepID=A0A4Q2D908_9AGAR|nr:hypothetical protein EST38_g11100 [Candolleomyces aberdarensis]
MIRFSLALYSRLLPSIFPHRNDYGELNYFGTIQGSQPSGTHWADGSPHIAWFDMSEYYIKAFKTGSYRAITKDAIYYWSKPHPTQATASVDGGRRPDGNNWSLNYLWVAVFATSPAHIILNSGVSKLRVPSAAGKITVQMVRGGQMIIDRTPDDFTYVTNPVRYNYNAYVGTATASSGGPASTSTTTTSTTTSSTSTTTSTSII